MLAATRSGALPLAAPGDPSDNRDMTTAQRELSEFHRFAQEQLSAGSSATLQELLDAWTAAREHELAVAAIEQSIAEADAGLGSTIDEAFNRVRAGISLTEHEETLTAVREGLEDIKSGRVRPAEEVLQDLRRGLPAS